MEEIAIGGECTDLLRNMGGEWQHASKPGNHRQRDLRHHRNEARDAKVGEIVYAMSQPRLDL